MTTEDGAERHIVVFLVARHLHMAFFDVKRELLEEELGELAHFFGHLDTHNLTVALDLSDRVAGRQTG